MNTAKMSGEDRRTAILSAARRVFVEKGFYRTTTRELADAAGVSEALLFKHFPQQRSLLLGNPDVLLQSRGIETPGATGVAGTVDVSPRVYGP